MQSKSAKPTSLLETPRRVLALGAHLGHQAKVLWAGNRPGARPPESRALLFGDGRVGSTLLTDLLDSHPDVRCENEILHIPVLRPVAYAEARAAAAGTRAYGFKLLGYQLRLNARRGDPRELLTRFVDGGWRIVHMKRENVLRQAVSALVSRYRKQWHSTKSEGALRGAMRIDVEDLRWMMDAIVRDTGVDAKNLGDLPRAETIYERDLLDADRHQATADRMFAFLGLPSAPVRTRWAKVTPKRLRDFVANYDEMAESVAAGPYARFLEAEQQGEAAQAALGVQA